MSRAQFYGCPFSCGKHAISYQEYRDGWQLGYNSITLKLSWWIQDGEVFKKIAVAPSKFRFDMAATGSAYEKSS